MFRCRQRYFCVVNVRQTADGTEHLKVNRAVYEAVVVGPVCNKPKIYSVFRLLCVFTLPTPYLSSRRREQVSDTTIIVDTETRVLGNRTLGSFYY